MKRGNILFTLLVLTVCASAVSAQTESGSSLFSPGGSFGSPTGFLDALFHSSRFSMSQSYSMSVGSYGGQGYNQGLYLNTMNFQLAEPLFMQLSVGYAHQPFNMGGTGQDKGQFFLRRAMLQYKPSSKTEITLEYQSIPSTMFSPYYLRR